MQSQGVNTYKISTIVDLIFREGVGFVGVNTYKISTIVDWKDYEVEVTGGVNTYKISTIVDYMFLNFPSLMV